jgi:hypothetical protein
MIERKILQPWDPRGLLQMGGQQQAAVRTTPGSKPASARGWERTFGGGRDDSASALAVLPDGGLAVAGDTRSRGAGGTDIWVLRLDADGNLRPEMTASPPLR